MTKCVRCGVDNEENIIILVKYKDDYFCGSCLSKEMKRDVRSTDGSMNK